MCLQQVIDSMKFINEKLQIGIAIIVILSFFVNIGLYIHEDRTNNAVIAEQNKFFAMQISELKETVNELRREMHEMTKARYAFYERQEKDA